MSSNPRHSFFRSLLARLTLLYVVVLSTALIGVYALLSRQLTQTAIQQTDRFILGEANRMLDLAGRRKPIILQSEINRFILHYGSNEVALSLSSNNTLLASSAPQFWHSSIPSINTPLKRTPIFISSTMQDGRTIRTVIVVDETGMWISMKVSAVVENLDRELAFAKKALAIAMTASLFLGTVLAYLLTRSAFSRIERVRMAAEAIASGEPGKRIEHAGEADEVAALTSTFNHMLERIDNTLAELRHVTDNMAHDLRTPLTRMRAAAESALLTVNNPEQQTEALSSVLEECARLERMTGTLLQIVRMDSGAYRPGSDSCNMNSILSKVVELMEPSFQDKNISLRLNATDSGLHVNGDHAVLERVFANLLDNALKFTPSAGSVTVTSSLQNDTVIVSVSDTGVGIATAEQGRIFERFHRSNPNPTIGGLGLGLSFVQAAVRAHGGTVTVSSEPGKSSTFTVQLPATRSV